MVVIICQSPPSLTKILEISRVNLLGQIRQQLKADHTKYQGHRSNGSAVRVSADGRTDGRTPPSTLSPSLRGR